MNDIISFTFIDDYNVILPSYLPFLSVSGLSFVNFVDDIIVIQVIKCMGVIS